MPSALLHVRSLCRREPNSDILWFPPDHVECGFVQLFKVEIGALIETVVCKMHRSDSLNGKCEVLLLPIIPGNQIETTICVPQFVWIDAAKQVALLLWRSVLNFNTKMMADRL